MKNGFDSDWIPIINKKKKKKKERSRQIFAFFHRSIDDFEEGGSEL